jgi:hypothetical protein
MKKLGKLWSKVTLAMPDTNVLLWTFWTEICTTFCLMTSVFTHMKSKFHNDILKRIRTPEWCSMGGSGVSWMQILLFFTDWLCLMRPIFTSLGMSINKSANTGALSNHTGCLKVSTQFKSHNLVQSVSFWNYWASFLWRRQLYNHHNLSMILSSSGDVGSGCWWHQCWALVSFRWFLSIYSMWIYGLCDNHVSKECHLTG